MAEALPTVRALTGLDTAELPDDAITGLLAATGGSVLLASAAALETVAGQLLDVTDPEGLSVKGSTRASVLMARAGRLRAQHTAEAADAEDGFFFDTVGGPARRPELTEYHSGWRWPG